jgi:hypothetical protein
MVADKTAPEIMGTIRLRIIPQHDYMPVEVWGNARHSESLTNAGKPHYARAI